MSQPLEHLWHGNCPLSNQNTILSKLIHLDIAYQYWSSNLNNNNQRHILRLVYYTSLYNIYIYHISVFPCSGSLPQKHLHAFSYKPSSKNFGNQQFNLSRSFTKPCGIFKEVINGSTMATAAFKRCCPKRASLEPNWWREEFPADWRLFDV